MTISFSTPHAEREKYVTKREEYVTKYDKVTPAVKGMIMQKPSVYKTDALKRYCFPTHCTDLIIDRKDSEAVEVFFAVLKPGEKTVPHKHDDCEQLWHVVEGCGTLFTGPEREEHAVRAGDVVLARRNVLHSVENSGPSVLRYLAIDVFVGGRPKDEPTWDSHVAAVCRQNGWNVSIVDVKHER